MKSVSRIKLTKRIEAPNPERVLLGQFRAYLEEIFCHDGARGSASLEELMMHHAFDYVEAAGLLADSEFGAELAGEFCRRACALRHMATELTEFLDAPGPAERAELPTLKSARYREELQRQHPELQAGANVRIVTPGTPVQMAEVSP